MTSCVLFLGGVNLPADPCFSAFSASVHLFVAAI